MTPTELNHVLERALRQAVADGELPPSAAELPDRVTLRNPPHGEADLASNLALRLAPTTGHPALRIAEVLRTRLAREAGIDRVEVAGPGFLNITLGGSAQSALVRDLLEGRGDHAWPPGPPLPEDPARDAARWAALTGRPVSHERRDHVPLFRVQYARSRSHALTEGARQLGFGPVPGSYRRRPEAELLALLADTSRKRVPVREHPPAVDTAARGGAPHPAAARFARHLQAVADAFLNFTTAPGSPPVLPQGDEKPTAAHRSRLALAAATGVVLAGGLTQLGISSPHYL